jgi:hypothetical protein
MKYRMVMFQLLLLLTLLYNTSVFSNMDRGRYFRPIEIQRIAPVHKAWISGEPARYSSISINIMTPLVYWLLATVIWHINELTQNVFGLAFLIQAIPDIS